MHTPRLATADDVPQLAALYAHTASTLGGWCYSAEQVQAWASFGQDLDAFAGYVLQANTWVHSGQDGRLLGFCGVSSQGEVHSLYVRADHTRQGLGRQMLDHALTQARSQGVQGFAA